MFFNWKIGMFVFYKHCNSYDYTFHVAFKVAQGPCSLVNSLAKFLEGCSLVKL